MVVANPSNPSMPGETPILLGNSTFFLGETHDLQPAGAAPVDALETLLFATSVGVPCEVPVMSRGLYGELTSHMRVSIHGGTPTWMVYFRKNSI